MKRADLSGDGSWLDFTIDPEGLEYIRATHPSKLAWEGIGGTVWITATWTPAAKTSTYAPAGNTLFLPHAVLSAIVDELVVTCRNVARNGSSALSVVLHGTPLELLVRVRDDAVEVSILEFVDYSDRQRKLGTLTMSRHDLLQTTSGLVEKFVGQLVAENPSLVHHRAVRSLRRAARSFRPKV